ncbi:tRNA 2-thiouridine(34) synthase MnmA [Candidatus Peregrinibacteria bacterium]|nr:tRNA 2-thiouridine(34) synthase MnmA [Candidatus Peregrinibacteria bacterium]
MKRKQKVLVAMSGGVDSSVAAALLTKKGYECIGIYLNFWSDPTSFDKHERSSFPSNKCCSIETANAARRVADMLGMPFYTLNVKQQFKKDVVDYFIDTYRQCRTPNPCVECNRHIKFGFLLKRMRQLGADYIATGHFARIKKRKGGYALYMGKDKMKDQSYFLYTLTQDQLKHILFPVGGMHKKKVKKLAHTFGLHEIKNKKESQGICFFPDKKHEDFLKRYFPEGTVKPGPIKTTSGETIGEHNGLPFFTVGQRKGIDIGGVHDPWYVVRLDFDNNALIVGKNHEVFQDTFHVNQISFTEKPLSDGDHTVYARIRYRFPPQKAHIEKNGDTLKIVFAQPQRAITPGQSVVFYDKKRVIGGGIINEVVYTKD